LPVAVSYVHQKRTKILNRKHNADSRVYAAATY
jgi:hypothetical protein